MIVSNENHKGTLNNKKIGIFNFKLILQRKLPFFKLDFLQKNKSIKQ